MTLPDVEAVSRAKDVALLDDGTVINIKGSTFKRFILSKRTEVVTWP